MNKFSLICFMCLVFSSAVICQEEDELEEELKYVVTQEAWFDVGVKRVKSDDDETTEHLGRVTIGLFGDIVPMTATNFAQLAKGFKKGDVIIFCKISVIRMLFLTNFIYIL